MSVRHADNASRFVPCLVRRCRGRFCDTVWQFWLRPALRAFTSLRDMSLRRNRLRQLWLRPALSRLGFGTALRAFTSLRDMSLRRNLRLSHRCAM
jgi:hypothetical protein